MTDEKKIGEPESEEFEKFPQPEVTRRRHCLGGGGYATLETMDVRGHVTASLATTKEFPPIPKYFDGPDLRAAVGKVEAAFAERNPDHVCSDACDLHWKPLLPGDENSSRSSGIVN